MRFFFHHVSLLLLLTVTAKRVWTDHYFVGATLRIE